MYKGQWADQRGGGHKRMNAFGVHTGVQKEASCVSVVISAFFSVCVKVKQSMITGHSGESWGGVRACRGFPLNTGGGGIPAPRRWLLKPNLKEF